MIMVGQEYAAHWAAMTAEHTAWQWYMAEVILMNTLPKVTGQFDLANSGTMQFNVVVKWILPKVLGL